MLFSIKERLSLVNILPEHGNAVTLRLLREFQNDLSFTDKEREEFGLTYNDGNFKWDDAKAKNKEIVAGEVVVGLIVTALKQRDAQGQLHMAHLELFDRFVSEKPAEE